MKLHLHLLIVVAVAGIAPLPAAGRSERAASPEALVYSERGWQEIVAEARGSQLFFHMWGGSETINSFVRDYLGARLQERYDIDLRIVPVADISASVSQLLGERQAGVTTGGAIDLMWINGENFRTLREAELLFGPYAEFLPNIRWVDTESDAVAFDFGFPVDGYESPYGSAQFALFYDAAVVDEPPSDIDGLLDWIRANPGRFTYPAPPDFTGSAFVRHIFYYAAGGPEALLGPFDEALFREVADRAWEILNGIEPFLWRGGETYPESRAAQSTLYAQGEIFFDMAYNPNEAATLVAEGRYPETTRPLVLRDGTISNTHFVAIPFNTSVPAAALVVANELLDPEVQLRKADPVVWGDLPAIDVRRLTDELQAMFAALPTPPQAPDARTLASARLPELRAAWIEAIETDWRANVLIR